MDDREKKHNRSIACLFPLALIYYEIVFRIFTTGGIFRRGTAVMVLFCCAYGGVGYLLATVSKNRRVNYYITLLLLLLAAVPSGVEAFVYRAFKIFFDFRAIVEGAGDVAADFSGAALSLIFSFRGVVCIALYLLPSVLYMLFGTAPKAIGGRARSMALARTAAFYVIGVLVIHTAPTLSRLYGSEYSFNAAVEEFGFFTALRLDAREDMFGRAEFQDVDVIQALSTSGPEAGGQTEPGPSPESAAPQVYGPNRLDLPLDDPNGTATDAIRALNSYVASQTPSMKNAFTGRFRGKNLIMITAEAFTREAIDPALTPTLYRLATKGVQFTDYYQFASAGTTGGEYQHIFGLLPTAGLESFTTMTRHSYNMAISHQLSVQGYYGKAYHNGTYTYYDRDETHARLGYSDGFMAVGNGMEDLISVSWPASDLEMFQGTVPTFIDRQPFTIYYMTISGHGPYSFDNNAMSVKNRDRVEDLPYSDPVKGYIASCLELEDAMSYLVGELEARGIADDTVICMTGDHFPYGLDDGAGLGNVPYLSELYGYDVENTFQRDHNCWLLWCGELEDAEPIVIDSPTSSLDILPTLYNLFGLDFDSRLFPGRDVFSDAPALVFTETYSWKSELGEYENAGGFVPADESAVLPDGYVENMKTIVRNKVNYCAGVLESDYFGYLFRGG